MTTEEKFKAAVNVIRSLPTNGSYQPSTELMLRFYAYYKQATEGPCKGPRPAFWEVIARTKYDAWKKLGDMPKATAMAKYVEELHSIVETMSFSEKVANFLEAPTNELDSINMDDLELIAGDVLERVRSQPNSPFASREGSPNRLQSSFNSSRSVSPVATPVDDSDHSDDEYIDTIEAPEPKKLIPNGSAYTEPYMNGVQKEHPSRARTKSQSSIDVSQEIAKAVQTLRGDIDRLNSRVNILEDSQKLAQRKRGGLFTGLSPQLIAFIIAWPFVATLIMNRFVLKKN